jgi:hypothetical protein
VILAVWELLRCPGLMTAQHSNLICEPAAHCLVSTLTSTPSVQAPAHRTRRCGRWAGCGGRRLSGQPPWRGAAPAAACWRCSPPGARSSCSGAAHCYRVSLGSYTCQRVIRGGIQPNLLPHALPQPEHQLSCRHMCSGVHFIQYFMLTMHCTGCGQKKRRGST